MRKLLYWAAMLCLVICLAGCTKDSSSSIAEPTATVSDEIIPSPEVEAEHNAEEPDTLIDTEYYTITIPESWCEDCIYEIVDGDSNDYSLCFYDKSNYEESGGWLFSIVMLTEQDDYTYFPSYEVLGSIDVPNAGTFNIIASYPTDVQFSNETAAQYCGMHDAIPDVLKTVSYKENCTFSETPVDVQPTMQQP